MSSPLTRVSKSKSPFLPGMREGFVFTKVHCLYKFKFSLQKENLCPAFRASASSPSSWPSAQNNPYDKTHILGWLYSDTL